MITPEYIKTMSLYNAWVSEATYVACDQLSDKDRKADIGLFFKSIHGTLNHLLWGDQVWMYRLTGTPAPISEAIPGSTTQYDDYDEMRDVRLAFDQVIVKWASGVQQSDIDGELSWFSSAVDAQVTKPRPLLIMQMFNHQTHHRGQIHGALTRAGIKAPVTDLPFMP